MSTTFADRRSFRSLRLPLKKRQKRLELIRISVKIHFMELETHLFDQKVNFLKKEFLSLSTPEKKYQKLMELGRTLAPYPEEEKTAAHLVKGCQSQLYLYATLQEGKVYFKASSDALISAGLAALLISVYSGLSPIEILKCPPTFIQELGLSTTLSLSRSNGLAHIHLKMKQEALRFEMQRQTTF